MSRAQAIPDIHIKVFKSCMDQIGLCDFIIDQERDMIDDTVRIIMHRQFKIPTIDLTNYPEKIVSDICDKILESELVQGRTRTLEVTIEEQKEQIESLKKEQKEQIESLKKEIEHLSKYQTHYDMQFKLVHGKECY